MIPCGWKKAVQRFACLFLLVLFSLTASADGYEKLWKQVNEQQQKDLPKTAATLLNKIREKALKEHNQPQLLKALLVRYQLMGDIAPDSAAVACKQLEQYAQTLTDSVQLSLTQSALGLLYTVSERGDTASATTACRYFRNSIRPVSALSQAKSDSYLPVVVKGNADEYFNQSLLPLVFRTASSGLKNLGNEKEGLCIETSLINFYRSQQMPSAVLLLQLDSLSNHSTSKPSATKWLVQTAKANDHLPVNVETYIALAEWYNRNDVDDATVGLIRHGLEQYRQNPRSKKLQNFINELEVPEIQIQYDRQYLYPDKACRLEVNGYNIKQVKLTVTPLPLSSWKADEKSLDDWKKVKLGKCLSQQIITFSDTAAAWHKQRRDVTLTFPTPGIYYVTAETEKGLTISKDLHVSRLFPIAINTDDNKLRVTIVDALSGNPVKATRLKGFQNIDGKNVLKEEYTSDDQGNIWVHNAKSSFEYYAVANGDSACNSINLFDYYLREGYRSETLNRCQLITDRTIYRPGQTVYYSLISYAQKGDEFNTHNGKRFIVQLYDSNGKQTAADTVTTNTLGSCGGKFTLPESCLPGRFSLRTEGDYFSFSVEEYKRPTFQVSLDTPTAAYAQGDTVAISGKVTTYSGLPVSGAKVHYRINRQNMPWFFYTSQGTDPSLQISEGTVETSADGLFTLPAYLQKADETTDNYPYWSRRTIYSIATDVTTDDGETETAQLQLFTARRSSVLEAQWPQEICKEHLPQITISHLNPSQKNIDGTGTYRLLSKGTIVAEGHFTTGKAFMPTTFRTTPSGFYRIETRLDNETDTTLIARDSLYLFSTADHHLLQAKNLFSYTETSADKRTVTLHIGTTLTDATLFYDIFSTGKLVESKRLPLSDTLITLQLPYREEYGDGARAVWALVRNGSLYSGQAIVEKPRPDKRLLLRWSSFRSRLQPGQKEEWRLRIERPDGSTVPAAFTASLTDASLLKFGRSSWNFDTEIGRVISNRNWQFNSPSGLYESQAAHAGSQPVSDAPTFLHFNESLFTPVRRYYPRGRVFRSPRNMMRATYAAAPTVMMEMDNAAGNSLQAKVMKVEKGNVEETPQTLRTNFAETAFFYPSLITDDHGEVALKFTLPESLTSWRFQGIAHNAQMDWGYMDTTVVAQKDFMLQANLPRYLRQGDQTGLSTTLRNMTSRNIKGIVVCLFIDPRTGKTVQRQEQKFSLLSNGAQAFDFSLTPSGEQPLLICRLIASGDKFSDGEEHFIPVLSDRVSVTTAIPFSINRETSRNFDISHLFGAPADNRRLSIEFSSQPVWYAVESLPTLAQPLYIDAYSQATAYYATCLAKTIADRFPSIQRAAEQWGNQKSDAEAWWNALQRNQDLKQIVLNETPWVRDAENEEQRHQRLATLFNLSSLALQRTSYLDKLTAQQLPDGSWGWYPGMRGNYFTTIGIAELLTRLQSITGNLDGKAAGSLQRAMTYLNHEVDEAVRLMQQEKKPQTIGENHLRYLYICALQHAKLSKSSNYLLSILKKEQPAGTTMYHKALTANVLMRLGERSKAHTLLNSLVEHTVATNDMGRYFDTDRAALSWNAYKIPTQTAAIEALSLDSVAHAATLDEMRLWLMQSRRTEAWNTQRATIDAITALLSDKSTEAAQQLNETAPEVRFTLTGNQMQPIAQTLRTENYTAGYSRVDFSTDSPAQKATQLKVEKTDKHLLWGAVYAQYTQPLDAQKTDGKELSVEMRIEVLTAGKWQPVTASTLLQRGQRVRTVFIVTATRDFDFVSLHAPRPACMEPTAAHSGYNFGGYYRALHDASTDYFFDRMAKGSQTLTDEFFIDRTGTFRTGSTTVQCQYAPEFVGHSSNLILQCK